MPIKWIITKISFLKKPIHNDIVRALFHPAMTHPPANNSLFLRNRTPQTHIHESSHQAKSYPRVLMRKDHIRDHQQVTECEVCSRETNVALENMAANPIYSTQRYDEREIGIRKNKDKHLWWEGALKKRGKLRKTSSCQPHVFVALTVLNYPGRWWKC